MKLRDLGYKILVVDEKATEYFLNKVNVDELEEFSKCGKIYLIGENAGNLEKFVSKSGGEILNIKTNNITTDVTSLVRNKKHMFINWSETFGVSPKSVKSHILYIKFTENNVLTDLPSFFSMGYKEYIRKKDCYLRLIAHGMENCPHNCIYCYANYSYDVSTTILINFKDRLKEDIKKREFSNLINQGFPLNIGSITDPFSKVAFYFGLVKDFLEVAGDINSLIVTKSIYFSMNEMLNFLGRFKKLKITFTYTGLSKYELNMPYDNQRFPEEELAKAIESGLDINVFYRPILENENDDKKYMNNLFLTMKSAGIKHICVGFLRSNRRMESSLSERFPNQFKRITKNLTDKYMDDFYPPLGYRTKKLLDIHNILYHNDMEVSTCQPYVGEMRELIETTNCSCRKERWGK